MPRGRTRYHQPPTRQRTPTPTLIPTPAATPAPRQPRLNPKLLTGAFLIFLSLLIFLAVIKDLHSRTPWPAYKPLPSASTWFESSPPHSTPRTPQKAIRKTLKTISTLVTELNRTLTTTCPGLGTWVFLGGVADIALPFEARVQTWGLGGATVTLAGVVGMAFRGLRVRWYWCLLFMLGAAFGGMVLGVFVTPEELLVKWKEETRAEAENLAYAERQMGR
ncbi:hypothetical protein VC83_02802 [Pseudogymnoascus destructans]|uniref:Uncharacterized protein n=1 Tax=Pseudogymnoascus destructans TaxID=655981 RepID=A0A177ADW6_9PEZI|nr:uncharacterized protein VC83_02802 [Pseudogymnoascus destructans]OAF60299.1 hypothetical protein VC83_02802 [Pseudogymnoascus destructans]